MKFKQGDIVVLKSGGPSMTIKDNMIHVTDEVKGLKQAEQLAYAARKCVWFEGDSLREGFFSEHILKFKI